MRKTMLSMFVIILLLAAFLAGCTKEVTVYVCADGKTAQNKTSCGINKVAGVSKIEAETYAKNYVTAYFLPYGGKAQMVSSYLDAKEGDFLATFIVAEKDGTPYETEVTVDGLTGKVSCKTKCEYAGG
ncbi:hypothetical protein KY363_07820 [Candidatus Woesearchaeota archaeon]|nr:hypothetical protein [Candidatus Woesearchaeota archaeon]